MNFQCEYCATGHHLPGLLRGKGHAGPPEQDSLLLGGNICRCGASRGDLTWHPSGLTARTMQGIIAAEPTLACCIVGGTILIDSLRDDVEQPGRLIDSMLWAAFMLGVNDLIIGVAGLCGGRASMDPAVEPINPNGAGRPSCLTKMTSEESRLG